MAELAAREQISLVILDLYSLGNRVLRIWISLDVMAGGTHRLLQIRVLR